MKYVHTITITVFCKEETEKYDDIKKGFLKLISFLSEDEQSKIDEQKAEGVNENIIRITKIHLTMQKHTTKFLKFLMNKLTHKQKELLIQQIDTRVDDELNFFLRFDKQKLIDDEFVITDSGNCYHISMNVAGFPRTKEAAKKVMLHLLQANEGNI